MSRLPKVVNPHTGKLCQSGSQACTLPTSLAVYLQARPSVLLKLPFTGVYELVVLWPCVTFFFNVIFIFSMELGDGKLLV